MKYHYEILAQANLAFLFTLVFFSTFSSSIGFTDANNLPRINVSYILLHYIVVDLIVSLSLRQCFPTFQGKQDSYKKPKYVQISVESYSHLTGLEDQLKSCEDQIKTYEDEVTSYEDQVRSLEDEVNDLNEKLSAANSEMTTKENLVKQHAKVAEEAVSGALAW